jgi:4-carboxymuconolactone decarboxylase
VTAPQERIPPLPFAEWDAQARTVLPPYLQRPELFESGGGDRPMPAVFRHYARHLRLGEPWLRFSNALMTDPLLNPRHREILVLRVSWRTRSAYEWHQHVRIGRQSGLSTDHVRAIIDGPDAELWTPVERALLTAADELIDRFVISDRTWETLRAHFDDVQLIEVLFVVGAYVCNAIVLNSVGLHPDLTPEVDVPSIPPSQC